MLQNELPIINSIADLKIKFNILIDRLNGLGFTNMLENSDFRGKLNESPVTSSTEEETL